MDKLLEKKNYRRLQRSFPGRLQIWKQGNPDVTSLFYIIPKEVVPYQLCEGTQTPGFVGAAGRLRQPCQDQNLSTAVSVSQGSCARGKGPGPRAPPHRSWSVRSRRGTSALTQDRDCLSCHHPDLERKERTVCSQASIWVVDLRKPPFPAEYGGAWVYKSAFYLRTNAWEINYSSVLPELLQSFHWHLAWDRAVTSVPRPIPVTVTSFQDPPPSSWEKTVPAHPIPHGSA